MSRTYKDQPNKPEVEYEDRYDEFQYVADVFEYEKNDRYAWRYDRVYTGETRVKVFHVQKAGIYTKKKRSYMDPNDWWYRRTPSWFIREFMHVPKRAACRNWEKDAAKHHEVEEIPDCPDYGHKPHVYFW